MNSMNKSVSGRVEDYLKVTHEVAEQKGYVRINDISKELGVKPSTVVENNLYQQTLAAVRLGNGGCGDSCSSSSLPNRRPSITLYTFTSNQLARTKTQERD